MSNHEGDKFTYFLNTASEERARRERFRATMARFRDFLEKNGVKPEEVNDTELAMLTSAKSLIEAAMPEADSIEPLLLFKKKLQAHFKLKNYSEAWQELIDREFAGEPLGEDDIEILATQFADEIDISGQVTQQYDQIELSMLEALGESEISLLSIEQQKALDELIYLYTSRLSPADKLDQARSLLAHFDLEEEWAALLDHFFKSDGL